MPGRAIQQRMVQLPLGIVGGDGAVHQRVNGTVQVAVGVVNAPGIIAVLCGVDLLDGVAEDILILLASLLGDLHIGTVQGAQGHSAVEHQFHVAGAGSLSARRGDLLGNIGSGDNMLGVGAVVVLHKDHPELIGHLGVVVDHLGDPVDIADDGLGPGVAGGGLGTEDEHGGMEIGQFAVLQAEIDIHNGQGVHQLTLVLMEPLDLNVKDEVGIQLSAFLLGDDLAQLLLLLMLDGIELAHHVVIDHGLQICQTVQILQEVAADAVLEELGQLRVAQAHPAPGGHTVGLILEPVREDLVPVAEQVVLQDLAVDLGHAVDIATNVDREVRHMGGVVFDDEKTRMLPLQLLVNAADDVHDLGDHGGQQIQGPLLEGLGHDGMVGVGEGPLGNGEALLEIHALGHQQPDQLRDGHGGMGIVQLHGIVVSEAAQVVAVGALKGPQHILERRGGQDVLLLDAQTLAFPGGVVGIQHTGDVLSLVLLRQSPQVILVVEGGEVQLLFGLALPQPQGIDVVGAVADDGHIVGNGQHGMIRELDLHGVIIPAVGPGIAVLGPVIGIFLLAALLIEALLKQAELIPQAVAGQGDVAGSGRIQEAGSQAAQTAVAQRRVLDLFQAAQIHALGGEKLLHLVQNAQVIQIGIHKPADQVLSGEIIGLPLLEPGRFAGLPVVGDGHHYSLAQSLVELLGGGLLQRHVVGVLQLCFGPPEDVCAIVIHFQTPISSGLLPLYGYSAKIRRFLFDNASGDSGRCLYDGPGYRLAFFSPFVK